MNSDGYVDVLRQHILLLSNRLDDPSTDWIFMNDNAIYHRSFVTDSSKLRRASELCVDQLVLQISTPLKSLEFTEARVRRSIRSGDDLSRLEALLKQEWERLSQVVINRLIESMSS